MNEQKERLRSIISEAIAALPPQQVGSLARRPSWHQRNIEGGKGASSVLEFRTKQGRKAKLVLEGIQNEREAHLFFHRNKDLLTAVLGHLHALTGSERDPKIRGLDKLHFNKWKEFDRGRPITWRGSAQGTINGVAFTLAKFYR